jgi:phage tail protein X
MIDAAAVARANQHELLDALVWRATGQRTIEAVLAANPGLADLGAFLPQGTPVDIGPASTAAAVAAAGTRQMIQLWD